MLEIEHLVRPRGVRTIRPLVGFVVGVLACSGIVVLLALAGCGTVTADDPPGADGGAGAGGAQAQGGRTGTTGGGTAGGPDAAAGAGPQAVPMLDCTATNTVILPAGIFCQNLLANCGAAQGLTLPAGYATQAACEATYTSAATGPGGRQCQGVNLCLFVEGYDDAAVGSGDPAVFCPAAEGFGTCANMGGSSG